MVKKTKGEEHMSNLVPDYNHSYICPKCSHQTPLYVKEWVGLTDKEVKQLSDYCVDVRDEIEFIRAIEEEIKEKNNG